MKILLFLVIVSLLFSHSSALFFSWSKSNCNSDRQCPTVRRRECPTFICIPFISQYRDTTVSQGKCINVDLGPLCNLFGGKIKI